MLIPFKDPHVLFEDKYRGSSFNERLLAKPNYWSPIDFTYVLREFNNADRKIRFKRRFPFFERPYLNYRDAYFVDDLEDPQNSAAYLINWNRTPNLYIFGHGGPGLPQIQSPKSLKPHAYIAKKYLVHENEVANLIQSKLKLPIDYSGTVTCLSCFSGLSNRTEDSFASSLSVSLYNAGYHNLTVEGVIGSVHPITSKANLKHVIDHLDVRSNPNTFNFSDEFMKWQSPDSNVYKRGFLVIDKYGLRAIPIEDAASKRQFFNGQMLFHVDDLL